MNAATADPRHTTAPPAEGRRARTVVVGFDRDPRSHQALLMAADRAGPDGRVVAVHVVRVLPGQMLDSSAYDDVRREHAELVESLQRELAELELNARVELEVVIGPVAEALIRTARSLDAEAIFVGARRLGALRSALTSTSRRVVAQADRPVVVVPHDEQPAPPPEPGSRAAAPWPPMF